MSSMFMAVAVFFPRLTLLFAWLMGNVPANDTPFALDVVLVGLFPRLWLAYAAWFNHEHIVWIALFVLLGLAEAGFIGSRRKNS